MNSSTLSLSNRKHRCHATEMQVNTLIFFSNHWTIQSPPKPNKKHIRKGGIQSRLPATKHRGVRGASSGLCTVVLLCLIYTTGLAPLCETFLQQLEAKLLCKRKWFPFSSTQSEVSCFYLLYPNKHHCFYTTKCRRMAQVCS